MRASQAAGLLRPRESPHPPLPPLGPPGIGLLLIRVLAVATDASGWLRSPALSSSWRWEHRAGRGGLSQPAFTPPTPPPPCPYRSRASETGDAGASGRRNRGVPSSLMGTMARARTTRVDCTTSCEEGRESGHHAVPRAPGSPDPLLRPGPLMEQGQHPTRSSGRVAPQASSTPSAGPSLLVLDLHLLVSPPQVCIPLSRPGSAAKGRGPWWEWDLPGPPKATRTSPSTPHPPAPAPPTCPWKSCRLVGLREKRNMLMKWIRMLGAVARWRP